MRLAVAVTSGRGGLLHYAVQMADGLADRGHQVDALVPRGHELTGHQGSATLREVLPLPVAGGAEPASRAGYLARRVGVAGRIMGSWARLNVEARRGRYDAFVIAEGLDLLPTMLAAGALTAGHGPVVAYVCHNVRRFNRWGGEELQLDPARDPMRFLYPRFDLVFVHGARSRAEFEAAWPPVRLAEIPHGDERLFGTEPPAPAQEERILFFGDWRKVKGMPTLMAAFDALAERRPQVRLTIAGTPAPSDFDPEIVRSWAAEEHPGRVTLVDRYVPLEEVEPLFASARVVCTPYDVGYQSGVVHLAQTMARPVVSTDVGDLGLAVLDGETGRLVRPGDVAALADALEAVVSDPDLAARYGAAAHARVTSAASWDTVAAAVEDALAPLVGAQASSTSASSAST
jgi:glycosyltransferase involved in cell wall biosynthesis